MEQFVIGNQTYLKILASDLTHFNFLIPAYQRRVIQDHVDEIYNYQMSLYKLDATFTFTGVITIARTGDMNMIIDGQHRFIVIERLLAYADFYVCVMIIDCKEEYIKELYMRINMNTPVRLHVNIDVQTFYTQVEKLMDAKYPGFNKCSKNPRIPHMDFAKACKKMAEYDMIAECGVSCPDELCELIFELNSYYSNVTNNQFKEYKICIAQQNIHTKCNKKGITFYLGLYKQYEWIERIISHTYLKTPYCDMDHSADVDQKKKIPIPVRLREIVWNAHFQTLHGQCYVCQMAITFSTFHCAHVIAEANGGSTNAENLKPTCSSCNLSMGTQNLEEYKQKYFFKNV